jgi:copper resistance protein D
LANALHITAIWMHVLGIALFVGPQFFLAFAWVPASRGIADMPTRLQAMRTITRRFAYIGGAGLVLIVIAGLYLIFTWRDFYNQPAPEEMAFTEIRYGVIFIIKMTVFLVVLALVGLHTFWFGPRQLDLMEARARGESVLDDDIRSIRIRSMFLSISGLLLVLAIIAMGAMLSTQSFSFQST